MKCPLQRTSGVIWIRKVTKSAVKAITEMAKSVDVVIVGQRTIHRNQMNLNWGDLEVRGHFQPNEPMTYFDETLIRIVSGETIPNDELRFLMRKQLLWNDAVNSSIQERSTSYETCMWGARDLIDSQLG